MNSRMKLWQEVTRLLRERVTLLFMALTAGGAVWFSLNSGGVTAADAYILNAAKNSAALGALLFSLLTLVQFHRDYRNNTDSIVFTCTDPVLWKLRRTLALVCAAIVTALCATLFTLPYAMLKTGGYFQASAFAASWYLIFLGALVLSVLLSSGLYMLLRRADAAFLVMAGLIVLSKMLEFQYTLDPSYMLFWVQTNASGFSDLVSNQFQIDAIVWNRLFCMLAALGVWLLGLCGSRRYGLGFFGSFGRNARRVWMPALLAASVALSGLCYIGEPIFDHSIPMDMSAFFDSGTGIVSSTFGAVETEPSDLLLTKKHAEVTVDTGSRRVSGKAVYTIQNLSGEAQDLSVTMNPGYSFQNILVNGQPARAVRDAVEENGSATWHIGLPACGEAEVELWYGGRLRNNSAIGQRIFHGISDGYVSIPPDGFSPGVDVDIAPDCDFAWTLALDENLTPEILGKPMQKVSASGGKAVWSGAGTDYINLSLTAADYRVRTFEAGGLEIQFKYFAKHEAEIEKMDAVRVMKAAIDYFTEAYGPLVYRDHLTMLELPASFGGGYAAGNTSAMDETCFAAAGYLPWETDTPDSGSGIETIVHEIAHQWWGLATYPVNSETSNWSAEGITCYSTYRFFEHYYGEEYAREHFIDAWRKNWGTYQNAFYIKHPEYLGKLTDSDASNVMRSLRGIALYDVMPLQLLSAEKALGGQDAFMGKMAELYQTHLFNLISFEEFLSVTGLGEEALDIA